MSGDVLDVGRRRAAAAAHYVYKAGACKILNKFAHLVRRLVVLAEFVGQAGVRISAGVAVGDVGQHFYVGPHFGGSEGTVQADRPGFGVFDGNPECLYRLSAERTSGSVGNGAGDHNRQFDTLFFEHLIDGVQRRFTVQSVENGFHQNDIHAAFDEAAYLFGIGIFGFIERERPVTGIVDVGRKTECFVQRTNGPGDELRTCIRMFIHKRIHCFAGTFCSCYVDIVRRFLQVVIGLRNGGCAECVGFDDIGAGIQVLSVDFLDYIRPREAQQVVVSFQVLVKILESFAPKIVFLQLVTLDHGPHGSVDDEYAGLCGLVQAV